MNTGTCPTCGSEFMSKTSKKFCSLRCYINSEGFKKRILDQCVKNTEASRKYPPEMVRLVCLECSKEFFVKPTRFYKEKAKYCSKVCYRKYMEKRFDRWIASPEKIALPQCFDEFLSKDELPCLIEGCDWRGKSLGWHVNATHGITAKEFKRIAGFNLNSGLVTPELSKLISDRAIANGIGKEDIPRTGFINRYVSLEAKEHLAKARALKKIELSESPRKANCRFCGKEFDNTSWGGHPTYCSLKCRGKYYRRRRWELECCQCGIKFLGERAQWRKSQKGLPVCCTQQCVAARNVVLTPAYKRHLEKMAVKLKGEKQP